MKTSSKLVIHRSNGITEPTKKHIQGLKFGSPPRTQKQFGFTKKLLCMTLDESGNTSSETMDNPLELPVQRYSI